jgi:hypothetical protein
MKKLLFFTLAYISVSLLPAAITTYYDFNATTGTYLPITGTDAGLSSAEALSSPIELGFAFPYGQDSYTAVKISTEGWVGIGTSMAYSTAFNELNSTLNRPVIAPLWDNLSLAAGSVQYLSSCSAPDRVFTVQYDNAKWCYMGSNQFDFQVRLHENGKIELIYGPSSGTPFYANASIGINMAPGGTGWYYSVTPGATATVSSTVENSTIATFPAEGTIYEFNPVVSNQNDLAALSVAGSGYPNLGAPNDYTITVQNTGSEPQSAYTVRLYRGAGIEIGSLPGTPINSLQILQFTIPWTPGATGQTYVYAEVSLAGDQNPANDQTPQLNVNVLDQGVTTVTVGNGGELGYMPVDMSWRSSLFEAVYLSSEINHPGSIVAVAFYNDFATSLPNMPTNIWMGETTQANLSAGWIPSTQLTQVYGGTVDYPSGQNEISITLSTPYPYGGGNLVLMVQRPLDTQSYSFLNRFETQLGSVSTRTLSEYSYYALDPANPPPDAEPTNEFPKTTLMINTSQGMGGIGGTVHTGVSPLAGATMVVVGTNLSCTTSPDGTYGFASVQQGPHQVSAAKQGYTTVTNDVIVIEGQTVTSDFELAPLPMVSVSGRIVGSDPPAIGLAGAIIQLSGYGSYNTTADGGGYFTIPGVYSNQTYQYVAHADGYLNAVGQAMVGATDLDLGVITLSPILHPAPTNVTAVEAPDHSSVSLGWTPPVTIGTGWLHYDGDTVGLSIGWGGALEFDAAIRYPASVLADYAGSSLQAVRVWPSAAGTCAVRVWTGGNAEAPGQLVVNQPFTPVLNTYNTVVLTNPVLISSAQELWFGCHSAGSVSMDAGPAANGLGNMLGMMDNWLSMLELNPSFNGNWKIQGYAGFAPPAGAVEPTPLGLIGSGVPASAVRPEGQERSLTGYQVSRFPASEHDNQGQWTLLTPAAIPDDSYVDNTWAPLDPGTYQYAVKAVYDDNYVSAAAFSNTLNKGMGTLTGTITDAAGAPLSIVMVSLANGLYHDFTDVLGHYEITDILPGSYTATFSKAGYITNTQLTTILPYQSTVLDVILTQPTLTGTLAGTVYDNIGASLALVMVTLDDGLYTGITDYQGHYEIPNIQPGTHTALFFKTGYVSSTQQVAILPSQTTVLNVTLTAKIDVTFQLDITPLLRRQLWSSGMALYIEVIGDDPPVLIPMSDPDADLLFTATHSFASDDTLGYSYMIDTGLPPGGPLNRILESGAAANPRTLVLSGVLPVTLTMTSFDLLPQTDPVAGVAAAVVKYLPQGSTATVDFSVGQNLTAVKIGTSSVPQNLLVSVARVNGSPGTVLPSGITTICDFLWWDVHYVPRQSPPSLNLLLDYRYIDNVSDPGSLRLLVRGSAGENWSIAPTMIDLGNHWISASIPSFDSQWAIGSTDDANSLQYALPEAAGQPSPGNGAVLTNIRPDLSWSPSANTGHYDIYLWRSDQPWPNQPLEAGYQGIHYILANSLEPGNIYLWRVNSCNLHNVTQGPVWEFTVSNLPDLQVSVVNGPAEVTAGMTFEVSWTVANQGLGSTTSPHWVDKVFITSSSSLPALTFRLLGTYPNLSSLSPGMEYYNSAVVTMPVALAGNYYLYVATDWDHEALEANEENNSTICVNSVHVSHPPAPDLTVTGITVPYTAFSDTTIPVSWTVANLGQANIVGGTWYDAIYFSQDANLDQSDELLTRQLVSRSLPVGQSYSYSLNPHIPPAVWGYYHIIIKTDYLDDVTEYLHEENNASPSDSLQILLTPPPDLVVSEIAIPSEVSLRESVTVNWQVSNQGTGPTVSGYWYDRVLVSADSVFSDSTAVEVCNRGHFGNLDQNTSYQASAVISIPDLEQFSGSRIHVHIFTDYSDREFEHLADGNNVGTAGSTVLYPDLEPVSVQADSVAQAGGLLPLSWIAENNGDGSVIGEGWQDSVFLASDPSDLNTWRMISQFDSPAGLPSGQIYNRAVNLVVPPDIGGLFYVVVHLDSSNVVNEDGQEANNVIVAAAQVLIKTPDLTVTDIALNRYNSGGTVNLGYTAANIGEGNLIDHTWADRIYLSADNQLQPSADYLLDTIDRSGSVYAGSDYSLARQVTLPNGIQGDYHFIVTADALESVYENQSETNNTLVSALVTVGLSASPDLAIGEVIPPASAALSDTISVSWTTLNQGVAPLTGAIWTDCVYLCPNGTFDPSQAIQIGSLVQTASLAAGASLPSSVEAVIPETYTGAAYLFVMADAGNSVYEHLLEENNASSPYPISILPLPPSDLNVSSFTLNGQSFSGQPLGFSATVANVGRRVTPFSSWTDCLYISTDQTLDLPGDSQLWTHEHSGILQPGHTYQVDSQITVPNGLSGTYYLFFVTDSANANEETNLSNNELSQALNVQLTPPPDLVVNSVSWSGTPLAGQPFSVEAEISNAGTGPTLSNWANALYLSADQAVNANDVLLTTLCHGQQLAPAGSYSQNFAFTLPVTAYGNNYLIAFADHSDLEFEFLNQNNTLAQPIYITLPPPCDLQVENVQGPATAETGEQIAVSWTLRNDSGNPAQGLLREGVYASLDSAWDIDDAMLGYIDHQINIPAHGTRIGEITVNPARSFRMDDRGVITEDLPGLIPSDYYFLVRTDLRDNIPEALENNNTAASAAPSAITMPLVAPGSPQNFTLPGGTGRYFAFNAQPDQTVRFSLSGLTSSTGVEIFSSLGRIPTRSIHDYEPAPGMVTQPELIIPTTVTGTYYVLVWSAASNLTQTAELSVEALPFGISSVQPVQGGNNGEVTLKVSGARFYGKLTASLYNPATQQTVNSLRRYYRDSVTHYVTFDLAGVPLGTYDVVLTADSLSTVLESGFQVIPGTPPDIEFNTSATETTLIGFPWPISVRMDISNNGNCDILLEDLVLVNYNNVPVSLDPSDFSPGSQVYSLHLEEEISGLPVLRPGAVCFAKFFAKPPNGTSLEPSSIDFAILPKSLAMEFLKHEMDYPLDWVEFINRIGGGGVRQDADTERFTEWMQHNLGDTIEDMYETLDRLRAEYFLRTGKLLTYNEILNILAAYATIYKDTPTMSLGDPISFAGPGYYEPPNFTTDLDIVPLQPEDVVYVLAHGYAFPGVDQESYMLELQNAIAAENPNARFIQVDWMAAAGSTTPDVITYLDAVVNVPLVAQETAVFLEQLGISPDNVIGVGQGMGAQVIELTAEILIADIPNPSGEALQQMLAIDPAGPGFEDFDFDPSVSDFTTVAHGYSVFGNPRQLGDLDVYFDPPPPSPDGMSVNDIVGWVGTGFDVGNEIAGKIGRGSKILGIVTGVVDIVTGVQGLIEAGDNRWKQVTSGADILIGLASAALAYSVLVGTAPAWATAVLGYLFWAGLANQIAGQWGEDFYKGIRRVLAADPNEILTPEGYGLLAWIKKKQRLTYQVLFENDEGLATAPAHQVNIEIPLDDNLSPSTFTLGSFGFANQVFDVPVNRTYYQQRLDVRDSLGVFVDVVAGIDAQNNKMFWIFQAIDPATGLMPEDPLLGFLPVNDSLHHGEGYVSYSIVPNDAAVTGDTVLAQAAIVFDVNQPILTGEALNTIDADPPVSQVEQGYADLGGNQYRLTLQANDGAGSGVAYRKLYMQTDTGPYEPIGGNLTEDQATLYLEPLHVYRFFSQATDNVSNQEPLKTVAELMIDLNLGGTTIASGAVSGVWTASQGPYHIIGGIWTEPGAQLQIQPGTEVVFHDSTAFNIHGRLRAHGVTFRSMPGIHWQGLRLQSGATQCELEACSILGGRIGERLPAELRGKETVPMMASRNASASGRELITDQDAGIRLDGCPAPIVSGNSVEGFQTGIKATGISAFSISNNVIKDCFNGINISSCGQVNLNRNTVWLTPDYLEAHYQQSGIALAVSSGPAQIRNNTVVGYGNGLYAENSTLDVSQNIFWTSAPAGVALGLFNSAALIGYNDIRGVWPGTNNLDADPLFVSAAAGDFALTPSSPCIDAGDPASQPESDGTLPDLGRFHYRHKADFRVSAVFAEPNDPLTFHNCSIGHDLPASQYRWDFDNDGVFDSMDQSPVHSYSLEGNYTVKLVATTGTLVDSLVLVDAVLVRERTLSIPANVSLAQSASDLVLTWDPVTTNINGSPAQVAGYLVYRASDPARSFSYLGLATSTTYTHANGATFGGKGFYVVLAVGGTLRDLIDYAEKHPVISLPENSEPAFRQKPSVRAKQE